MERLTSVAGGGFDEDGRARRDDALDLRILHHGKGYAVLDAASGVEELALRVWRGQEIFFKQV